MFRLRTVCLIICAATVAAFPVHGADEPGATPEAKPQDTTAVATNAAAQSENNNVDAQDLLRRVVILQEQLQATRQEVEKARSESELSTRHSERVVTDRLNFIEDKQVEMLKSSNRLTLVVVGGIAVITCFAVFLGGWLQMRAVMKLTEISQQLQMLPALAAPPTHRLLDNGSHENPPTDVDEHTAKLAENVGRLQTKLSELEHGSNGNSGGAHNGGGTAATQIAKGQTLLSLNKPAEALECFERAIALDGRNTEAWIKKGSALERLQRIDDAITAYDQAIQLDEQIATAYLFKAGVYNRQKRYAEALQCYEKALTVQKSRAAG